jgi:hypothetical protein
VKPVRGSVPELAPATVIVASPNLPPPQRALTE